MLLHPAIHNATSYFIHKNIHPATHLPCQHLNHLLTTKAIDPASFAVGGRARHFPFPPPLLPALLPCCLHLHQQPPCRCHTVTASHVKSWQRMDGPTWFRYLLHGGTHRSGAQPHIICRHLISSHAVSTRLTMLPFSINELTKTLTLAPAILIIRNPANKQPCKQPTLHACKPATLQLT